jgi:sn-glycerol 3-phosphate transport system substrate-binding protein
LVGHVVVVVALVCAQASPASGHSAPAGEARCATDVPRDGAERPIVLWDAMSESHEQLVRSGLAPFDAEHTGLSVELVRKPNYDLLVDELVATPLEAWPNAILGMEQSVANLARLAEAIPPGECSTVLDSGGLLPIIEATYTVDGRLRAVPFNVSTPVLIYNAAQVRAAGLDPDVPPRTLAELRQAADAITQSGVASSGFVVHDQYGAWFVRQFSAQRGHTIGSPHNGRADPIEEMDLSTSDIVADFEWLRDGVTAGSFLWIGGNPSGSEDLLRLPTERAEAAFTLHTSAALGEVLTLVDQGAFPGSELGVAPLPGNGGLVGGGAWWILDSGDPVTNRAVAEVLEFMVAPPQLGAFDAATGYVPPSESVAAEPVVVERWAEQPELRVGYDQLRVMDGSPAAAGLLTVPARDLDELLAIHMEEMLQPDTDIEALLAEIEVQFMSIVEANRRADGQD